MNNNNSIACFLVDNLRNEINIRFILNRTYNDTKEYLLSELWNWYARIDDIFTEQGYNHVVSLLLRELNILYDVN